MFFSRKSKSQKIKEKLAQDANSPFSIEEVFPDAKLAGIVAESIGVTPKTNINLSQLDKVDTLNAANSNISSLEGLEFLNGLKTANFSNNNISKLPDYTVNNPNLAKNKNTLILMDLSNNPFLDPNNLFSLDNSENRRKFIGQFQDSYNRFKLGEVKDRIFVDAQINPAIIRMAISALMPRSVDQERSDQINDIFLKYLIGKKVFYNKDVYTNDYILDNGKLNFRTSLLAPPYLSNESEPIVAQLIEQIIPKEDLYLLRSLIQHNKPLTDLKSNNVSDYIAYYQSNPTELSEDYILDNSGWKEKSNYTDLRNAALSTEEELMMQSIANPIIKKEYNRYIQLKDVLELYQNDHPEKIQEVSKIINKNEQLINEFLKQYVALEQNAMLTDKQKETIKQAEDSIQTFNKNYMNQATSLFEQDVFGLEVEMKYIDMLAEADKKIG